jgi:hypothetical protein
MPETTTLSDTTATTNTTSALVSNVTSNNSDLLTIHVKGESTTKAAISRTTSHFSTETDITSPQTVHDTPAQPTTVHNAFAELSETSDLTNIESEVTTQEGITFQPTNLTEKASTDKFVPDTETGSKVTTGNTDGTSTSSSTPQVTGSGQKSTTKVDSTVTLTTDEEEEKVRKSHLMDFIVSTQRPEATATEDATLPQSSQTDLGSTTTGTTESQLSTTESNASSSPNTSVKEETTSHSTTDSPSSSSTKIVTQTGADIQPTRTGITATTTTASTTTTTATATTRTHTSVTSEGDDEEPTPISAQGFGRAEQVTTEKPDTTTEYTSTSEGFELIDFRTIKEKRGNNFTILWSHILMMYSMFSPSRINCKRNNKKGTKFYKSRVS